MMDRSVIITILNITLEIVSLVARFNKVAIGITHPYQ